MMLLICERILCWSALDARFDTTLRIESSSIPAYQASVHPIRLQQIFLSTWFKVEGQVVERWERPTSTN